MNEMKTTIPKGTKLVDMDVNQEELYGELCTLEERLRDWLGTVQECIHYTEKNGLNYTITADVEDIYSFITIVNRQSERFYNEVTWGTGDE
tara:strand:- start:604 stop:876 length:273 start_codon:yes stop_codon:yes gene_type:complete